ncbi:Tetratricopeptide-like helical [Cordyceps fumosorosea ARSEF 2679]|uniref:Tetratricopeptide-like helical n=1 Tax=Cordyceps fumosorosea (strain ARSEF 2679) TaxID=1081104 RepID=A0A162LP73_CORFA|nr:Tetratricopeptide-like helical [Cordyceps fumosorosea ARSEF 2679]OAA73624.1 Tetratricopeptide-like helical [Cordyceps fumosorosea ARSEF 2679]
MSSDAPTSNNVRLRLVYRFLDCDLVENALFLLDRLHAQDPDNACWVHLRSLCCLRLARYAAAYEYSRAEAARGKHTGCVYVFAQACLHLNLPRDGIPALQRVLHQIPGEELKSLCDQFLKLGTAYYHLTRFQPRACLDALTSLDVEQQATPWVLAKTARAHYEMMAYTSARSAFETLRASWTSWTEDLEVHAAALWHLGDDVRLAHQAHDLTEHHRLSPQAWCAAGCAMSRAGRQQDAIASFRRAAQLRPPLARAYSLLGHEHFDCEEYDEANWAFRRALQVDARHYVAWVGLGRVQERLGAPERALRYYLGAQKISPDNGVVLTNIARIYDVLGLPELGLRFIRRSQVHASVRLAVFTKVQTAKLLLRVKEPEDAARELNAALEMAPDNAEIHLLLGQTVMEAGRSGLKEVLQRFTVALSLRPHSRVIKDAIASLTSPAKDA